MAIQKYTNSVGLQSVQLQLTVYYKNLPDNVYTSKSPQKIICWCRVGRATLFSVHDLTATGSWIPGMWIERCQGNSDI